MCLPFSSDVAYFFDAFFARAGRPVVELDEASLSPAVLRFLGAKGKGKAKALPKPLQPELDSSDEEILEALALGAQGK